MIDPATAAAVLDITRLDYDTAVIVTTPHRYVHLYQDAACLRIETSGNEEIPPPDRLTVADEDHLRAAGWHPPRPPLILSWHREFPWPLTAAAAHRALTMVTDRVRALLDQSSGASDVHICNVETFDELPTNALSGYLAAIISGQPFRSLEYILSDAGAIAEYELTMDLLDQVIGVYSARRWDLKQQGRTDSEQYAETVAEHSRYLGLRRTVTSTDHAVIADLQRECVAILNPHA